MGGGVVKGFNPLSSKCNEVRDLSVLSALALPKHRGSWHIISTQLICIHLLPSTVPGSHRCCLKSGKSRGNTIRLSSRYGNIYIYIREETAKTIEKKKKYFIFLGNHWEVV